MKYVPKTFLNGNFVVRSEFSCVRSSHDLCARAHAHSLEGTLVVSSPNGVWAEPQKPSRFSTFRAKKEQILGSC